MKTVFISNVGNRDVYVEGHPNLPKDSRTLGDLILKDWDALKPYVQMPILMKALEGILRQHRDLAEVVLFASDQPEDVQYRSSDTLPFAQVVTRFITEKHPQLRDKVRVITIVDNPASYDTMLGFYANELAAFRDRDRVYLHVSGGTPAMSFMLLWQGVEQLGQAAQPLYVLQEYTTPLHLDIGHKLMARAVVDDLLDNIGVYQYHAALSLVRKNADLLGRELRTDDYNGLVALLEHAAHRTNFRFDKAEGALHILRGNLQQQAIGLIDDMAHRDGAWLLREELFAAEVDYHNGALREMVAHVFSFVEELLYQYAVKLGLGVEADGKIDMDWLESEPDLKHYLVNEKGVRLDRGANTFVLDLMLAYFAKGDADLKAARKRIVKMLESLRPVRNTMTHDHGGVSETAIEQGYGKPVPALLDDTRAMYAAFSGDPLGDNPYDTLNALIASLVEPFA
jgi:hypothetical protein